MAKGSEDYLAHTAITTGEWSVRRITQTPNEASTSFPVTDARRERGFLEIVADHLRRIKKTFHLALKLLPTLEDKKVPPLPPLPRPRRLFSLGKQAYWAIVSL